MIPYSSSSMISNMAVLLPILGVVIYVLAIPAIRNHAKDKWNSTRSYFFHESELHPEGQSTTSTPDATAATEAATSKKAPINQIEPAGWNYDMYAALNDSDKEDPKS